MDIKREPVNKKRRRLLIAVGVAVAVVVTTVALKRLPTAAPSVERATLMIDTVRRGELLRQVRGNGTLVPEQIRLVSALTAGRVEQLAVRPGAQVTPTTALLKLSNPDVQLEALEAQRQLTAAEADLVNLRTSLETQRLTLRQQLQEARRAADVATSLGKERLMSPLEVGNANDRAEELAARLKVITDASHQQIALAQANVARLREIVQFQRNRIESMDVKAGDEGVLQEMTLELGQWVVPGQLLAKVAQPGRLKAVIRIPETQAKDLVLGQTATIDTHNGVVPGRVIRIDPQAQNGTVAVDVSLEGELPRGARPELSVDGTIEIERLPDVMYVARPAYGQSESTVGLFRLEPDGKTALRVNVRLGRSSVNTIEVLSGVKVGDKLIVSDMSNWDSFDRVRLR